MFALVVEPPGASLIGPVVEAAGRAALVGCFVEAAVTAAASGVHAGLTFVPFAPAAGVLVAEPGPELVLGSIPPSARLVPAGLARVGCVAVGVSVAAVDTAPAGLEIAVAGRRGVVAAALAVRGLAVGTTLAGVGLSLIHISEPTRQA